jgi:hypothetical protein
MGWSVAIMSFKVALPFVFARLDHAAFEGQPYV